MITAYDYKLSQSAEGQQPPALLNYNHSLPKEFPIAVQSSCHPSLNTAVVMWGTKVERREDRAPGRTAGWEHGHEDQTLFSSGRS